MMALGKEAMALFKVTDEQVRNGVLIDVNKEFNAAYTSRKSLDDVEARFVIALLQDHIKKEKERQAQPKSSVAEAS